MNEKLESLRQDLEQAVGTEGKTRSALIEGLFILFKQATSHSIAYILLKHNNVITELLQAWQFQMGGTQGLPRYLTEVINYLNILEIDALALGADHIVVNVQSVNEAYKDKKTQKVRLQTFMHNLRTAHPKLEIGPLLGGGLGQFALSIKLKV